MEEERFYYVSSYFSVLFPIYIMWRLWVLLAILLVRHQAAETFAVALRKPE